LTLCGAQPQESEPRQPLRTDIDGFWLQAAVRCEAHDRKRLKQLCRYITRPPVSDERVQCNAAGQVELKLKTPWRDGTKHLVMSPLEFMQRLAALVTRPRPAMSSSWFSLLKRSYRAPNHATGRTALGRYHQFDEPETCRSAALTAVRQLSAALPPLNRQRLTGS
jgi:hypothetical protein